MSTMSIHFLNFNKKLKFLSTLKFLLTYIMLFAKLFLMKILPKG